MTDTTLPDYAALAPKVLAAPTPAPVAVSPAGVPDYAALARNRAAAGVRNNMQFAPAANPDEEAQYRHLAQFIGAPLESVSADPGAARLRASLLATDADRLAAQAPTTAATLGDPSNARMLHDTIPNVVATEQTIAALGAQPQRGVWSDMGSAFASTSNKIGAAATRAELAIEPHLPKWLQSTPEDAAQLQTDVTDLNAKAATQAPQTLPGQVVAGLTYAPFAEAAPLVVAGAEGNAREAELLGKGVDPDAARLAAAGEGGLQGLIQMLPLGRLLFGAGAKPLLKSVAGATAKAGAAGAVQSVASDTATQQILAGVGTDQQTVDQYAPSIDKVLASAAFMAALHVGTQTVMGAHQGIGKPESDNVGQTDAAQATAAHGLLQKLGELATTGKFRERDSDAFRQFVSDVSDSTGAPDLYVDARQFAQTLDQAGVTVDELATKMPDVAAQMREALQSEGMVKIPLEDYAQHIAGGPVDPGLLPHLRTDPAGMSFDEAQKFYQEQAGQMTDAAGAVDKAAEKAAKQAKASELETVHDTVLDQLTATGRYTPEVSKAYAALTREFYGTTADRLGMTPAELFAKHPLRIEGADVAGEHLDQVPTEPTTFTDKTGEDHSISMKAEAFGHGVTQPNSLVVRAHDADGKPTGFIDFDVRKDGVLTAANTQVKPEYRGRGLAEAMYKAARDAGYDIAPGQVQTDKGLKMVESLQAKGIINKEAEGQRFRAGNLELAQSALNGENDGSASSTDAGSIREPGRLPGGAGVLATESRSDQGDGGARESDGSLVGLPRKVGKFTASAFPEAQRVAADYMARAGLPYDPPNHYVKVDPERAARIADAFEAMAHNPQDPAVKASYAKMIEETAAQYQAVLDAGLKVEFVKGDDPYAGNPRAMTDDVRDNNHMWVFSTRDGFGTDASFDPTDNPLLAETAFEIDGKPALANDLFRVVHDYFGHVKEGVGFRADGEENAWRAHMAMYSAEARGAATTETRGQNSWLNFGPYGETNRTAKVEDTHFADQKIGLLPDWAVNDGRTDTVLDQDARGTYSPETNTITALHSADLSTYLHELGHHFLETYARIAAEPGAPKEIVEDVHTLIGDTPPADWLAKPLDERRDTHETFARGFEAYLMEGKAPTPALQALYGRFRSWLLQVYKSLSALRVQLTPEVRQVMDRMLASQTEIEQAEKVRGMTGMFPVKPEGMSDEDFTKYQALGTQATNDAISDLQARSLRDMRWLSNAKSKEMKALQRQGDAERARIRDEVTQAYDESPAAQAKAALAEGEKAHEDHPFSADFNAQLIAEQHGFETVDAMHRAIEELGNRKTSIDAMVDQRMLEEHGELVDPRSIERAAETAVHNAARQRFIATELKALAKATGSAGLLAKAARAAADSAIAAKRVRDLRPDQYSAAEARAAKASATAFRKGDIQEAATQKRAQLLSNALARSATEAAGDIVKAVEYLKRFDKASIREKIDVDYRDQIDAILAKHDLRTSVTNRELATRKSIREWVEEQQAIGNEPMVPADIVDEANLTHYSSMTVESFRGLVDAVKSIEHLGRQVQKIRDGNDARDFRAVVDEAIAHMGQLPQRAPETNRGLSAISAKWLNVKAAGRSFDASLLKMEQVIDWLDAHESTGVFNRVVMRRIADAQARENDLRSEMVAKLSALAEAQPKGYSKDFDDKLTLAGLTDSKTGKTQILLKRELLAAALNSGNESNYQKMLAGEKWSDKALQAAFDKHLTKADWDYVQGVLNAVNHLWPEIEAMERRLGNTSPTKIEARPIVTRHGTYAGGYYPAVYDPLRAFDVEQNRQRAAGASLMDNNYQKATTSKGHTKERNENYSRPILLSLDVIPRHMTQVIHDIAYREALMDADRFLGDKRVREGIENVLGREHYQQFRPWLQALANDKVYDARGLSFWDKAAHWARTSTTMVGLGYRLSTMMIHGATAASNSVGEIGTRWMLSGVKDVLGSPTKMVAARDFIFERSGEMRHRMNEVDRDIRDQLREMEAKSATGVTSATADVVHAAKRGAFYGIAMLDMASALPTWMGAYNRGLHEGLTEDQAVYAADKAVRNAHGGTGTKDLAAIQRGAEFQKLFTMFYSFWNHFYNRQRDIARTAAQLPGKVKAGDYAGARRDFAMVMARSFFYFIAPQLLHAALKPPAPGSQDEDESWVHWASKEIGLGLFSGIPVVRDLANASVTGRDYNPTPAVSLVKTTAATGKDIMGAVDGQGPSDRWVAHAVQTAGYVFGLPTGQASNSVQFLWDVGDGKVDPQGLADWWRGLKDGRL